MLSTRLDLRSAHVPGESDARLPLRALDRENTHVHGELVWTIGDRVVPHMGFWGPHDVCLGEWWDGLRRAVAALAAGQPYVLDSGEQGEPAFNFERSGSTVRLSVVEGMGGGDADPAWQSIELAFDDLIAEVERFEDSLLRLLKEEGPPALPDDWNERLAAAAR
jgi:hypothetical protein